MVPIAEPAADGARRQLERLVASAGFSRNERMARFLQFVVEQHLAGKDCELKESVIAIEVFGRRPDHDPKQDSIVRTEAARLRARLCEFYLDEGKNDALIIELPKGGYVPLIRHAATEPSMCTIPPLRDVRRPRAGIWLWVAISGIALAAGAAGWWWSRYRGTEIPIAVLPFVSLSQDPANGYFADGLTDEIIRNLSIINGLAVRSHTSSFAFKGTSPNIREAGRQLGADYILEGSVLREGQQLRINARLIRVRDDFAIWSEKFNRELTGVFAIQDEISRSIVNSLRLNLGRGRRRYEVSREAYDLYLRARSLQVQRGIDGFDQSIDLLEAAVAKDPSFAPAYAALAIAYTFRSNQLRFNVDDQIRRMRAAADEAIRLDPLLAEGHAALAMAHARQGEWRHAEKSFHRAIELNPGDSQPYRHLAYFVLFPLGRIPEALAQLGRSEKLDPLGGQTHWQTAMVLMSVGRHIEAEAHCEMLPAEFTLRNVCLLWAKLRQGRVTEVVSIADREFNRGEDSPSNLSAVLGCAYARVGRREDAEKLAADTVDPRAQAYTFVCLGDQERAVRALDQAAAAGPVWFGRTLQALEFAALRGDPRLRALRNRVGLPE